MKRIGKALALALAVCLLLSACGGNASKGGASGGASGREDENVPGITNDELLGWPEAAEAAPGYGELPGRMAGSFYAGTTVVFSFGAFTTCDDGVYFLDARDGEPVLVVNDSIIYDTSICTDGFTVYYVSGTGELIEASLSDGGQRQVTNGADFPFHAGVVGAGADRAYVQIPGAYENTDEPADLDSVCAVSLESGEILETWDWFGGAGCAGGYTAIFGEGYDVGPRQLYVFDYDGNVAVDEEQCTGASVSGGHVFYSLIGPDGEGDGGEQARLYRVEPSGAVVALAQDVEPDSTPYGFYAYGFHASSMSFSGEGELLRDTYDLRTGETSPVPANLSYYDGWSIDGAEYLVGLSSVYRWRDGQADCIFELPEDLRYGSLSLCGNHILLDADGGAFYIFPLDPENVIHPIPVTASVGTLEEYDGKNGATVTGYYPVLMNENYYTREALSASLEEYNEAARLATQANAVTCANQASEQIENGFASPEDPFSVSTRVYIQRADTLVFSFMEHQTMDNRVNREAMDLRTGYNYDSADGHALSLDEVITDEDGLREILLDYLEEAGFAERDDLSEFLFRYFKERPLTSTSQFSWVLGCEGISFYFNGNTSFPYSMSSYKCTVPFTDAPEIFNPKYFNVPDRCAYDILLDEYFMEEYRMQADEGAVRVWPTVSRTEGDEGVLSVVIDGESFSAPVYGFPLYGTVIHLNDSAAPADGQPRTGGRNFLVVQTCGDGMDVTFLALDGGLNGQLIETWDFGQGALPQHLPEAEDWDYMTMGLKPVHVWLSNPDCFTVLNYDLSTENYTVKGVYDFNGGYPRLLDIFGASLAVG